MLKIFEQQVCVSFRNVCDVMAHHDLMWALMLRFGILGMDWWGDMWTELCSHNPWNPMKVVANMLLNIEELLFRTHCRWGLYICKRSNRTYYTEHGIWSSGSIFPTPCYFISEQNMLITSTSLGLIKKKWDVVGLGKNEML